MKKLYLFLILLSINFLSFGETYVVCIGIADYADPSVNDLVHTEKDAKQMASFYIKGKAKVVTLTGRNASKENIVKAMRSQYAKARKTDKIVLFFSGHGYPGGFCPYDISNSGNYLSYEDIINIMDKSEAADKFIFADACFSGGLRGDHIFTQPQTGDILFFLSSRPTETSIELTYQGNGLFTKYVTQGLRGAADANRDRRITASELFRFVSNKVKKYSQGSQHPVMWGNFPDNLIIVNYSKERH